MFWERATVCSIHYLFVIFFIPYFDFKKMIQLLIVPSLLTFFFSYTIFYHIRLIKIQVLSLVIECNSYDKSPEKTCFCNMRNQRLRLVF